MTAPPPLFFLSGSFRMYVPLYFPCRCSEASGHGNIEAGGAQGDKKIDSLGALSQPRKGLGLGAQVRNRRRAAMPAG